MSNRFAIERKLPATSRRAFDRYISRDLPTVDEATRWLKDRGFSLHRSCVAGYMRQFGGRKKAQFSKQLQQIDITQRQLIDRIGTIEKLLQAILQNGRK